METNNFTIRIENGLACDARYRMAAPINLCIREGWQTAIVGPNGAGKTLLVNTLLRQYPLLDNREVGRMTVGLPVVPLLECKRTHSLKGTAASPNG